jgi:hypothetical protein
VPFQNKKVPPKSILLSDCIVTELISYPLAAVPVLVVKVVSLVPSEFRRTMLLTATPFQFVKLPPIISF